MAVEALWADEYPILGAGGDTGRRRVGFEVVDVTELPDGSTSIRRLGPKFYVSGATDAEITAAAEAELVNWL